MITGHPSQHTVCPRGSAVRIDGDAIVVHLGRGAILDLANYPGSTKMYALVIGSRYKSNRIQYLLSDPVEPGSEVMRCIGFGDYDDRGHWPLEYSTKREAFMSELNDAPLRTVTIV